jgi:hypothetical protein
MYLVIGVMFKFGCARALPHTSAPSPLHLSSRGLPNVTEPHRILPAIQSIFEWAYNWHGTVKLDGPGITLPGGTSWGTSSAIAKPLLTTPLEIMLKGFCKGCAAPVVMSEQGVVS